MGWVPEGQRSASMSYTAIPVTLPYVTLGEEDTVTFEAEAAAQGFEDINATATLRILQKTMRKEETALLGGNASLVLGKPGTPTLSASGTGGTLPAATYSVIVVALTFEGYRNSTLAGGVATTMTITGNDGNTYTLSGGSSLRSTNATQVVAAGQTLFATVPVVNGAVAYAWYVGAAGSETLQAITTINSAAFSAPLATGQQPATAITADNSRNPGLAFDGLLTDGFNPATSSFVQALPCRRRGDRHVPYALRPRFDPRDRQYAAADVEQLSAVADGDLCQRARAEEHHEQMPEPFLGSARPLQCRRLSVRALRNDRLGVVRWYYNPFTGVEIPLIVHPDLPPGTILAYCERLPAWYQSNETPNVAEVLTRRDYYRVDWPVRTRRREFGVYTEEVLADLRLIRHRHHHQHRQRLTLGRANRREARRRARSFSFFALSQRALHVAIRSDQSRGLEGLARIASRARPERCDARCARHGGKPFDLRVAQPPEPAAVLLCRDD